MNVLFLVGVRFCIAVMYARCWFGGSNYRYFILVNIRNVFTRDGYFPPVFNIRRDSEYGLERPYNDQFSK